MFTGIRLNYKTLKFTEKFPFGQIVFYVEFFDFLFMTVIPPRLWVKILGIFYLNT